MTDDANKLPFWLDYLTQSNYIDEILEDYLLDEIERTAQKNKDIKNGFDGLTCVKCKNHVPYAELTDQEFTFICYACKHNC